MAAPVPPSKSQSRQNKGADPDVVHEKLGYKSADELLLHLPLRYEDETRLTRLRDMLPGQPALVEGIVKQAEVQLQPRRQLLVTMTEPGTGSPFHFRLLNFYPNQQALLKAGTRLRLYGDIRPGFFGDEMVHPRWRIVSANTPLPDALTPVYPAVAGLGQPRIQKAIAQTLDQADLSDTLPLELLDRLDLQGFEAALRRLHAPRPEDSQISLEQRTHPAWRRIKFDELLTQQLALRRHAGERHQHAAPVLDNPALCESLVTRLAYPLTAAQQRAFAEIRADLARPRPMHRLLQGDVGSGKTSVAALAALLAAGSGKQAAVMAPTEILAEQLCQKFREWLQPLGVQVAWLVAAIKGKPRKMALADIAEGRAAIAVGTHALFQEDVAFQDLALAIVDEQHRFGVEQRLAMRHKGSSTQQLPHLLMLSATPIPRSLAMSYFADLDVSVIDELPPGRKPITTKVINDSRREEVIGRLDDYCAAGAQAYWVCPLVEESEKLQLKAAIDTHAELCATLNNRRIGLVHGRLKADEKGAVMAAFKAAELDILVATTVIEVGVDVPNASLMVIEHAERMGLAQLHQLRGRVGRGERESACILLFSDPLSAMARRRLRILRDSQDGFVIAREDLAMRGPGEFLGARQSGAPMLRFANLETDQELLEQARDTAVQLLQHDPESVRRHLARWLPRGNAFLAA